MTTLNPYAPHRSSRQAKLYVLTANKTCLELQTQQLFASLSLTSQLSSVKQPCHCVLEATKAVLCLLVLPQHAESWPIFNSLDAEAIGISFTCSSSWLASSVLTWPSEDCNSQNICTYCTAQAMEEHCLKTIHFPHGAGYSPNNTAQMQRDAGNQAARSCWPCTRMNCKTTWLSPRRLPRAHRSQLLAECGIWREWHNNNENKTIENRNQRLYKFRKKRQILCFFHNQMRDSDTVSSHYLTLWKLSSKEKKG